MSKYLISLILLSVISMGVSAQRITRQYNNVSFSAALKDLNARQDKYVINFVYDELEDFRVTKSITISFVAHTTHFHNRLFHLARNYELTILICHTTRD